MDKHISKRDFTENHLNILLLKTSDKEKVKEIIEFYKNETSDDALYHNYQQIIEARLSKQEIEKNKNHKLYLKEDDQNDDYDEAEECCICMMVIVMKQHLHSSYTIYIRISSITEGIHQSSEDYH